MVVAKNSNAQIIHRQMPILPVSAALAAVAMSAFATSEAEPPAATASTPVVSVRDATYLLFPNLLTFKRSNVPTISGWLQALGRPYRNQSGRLQHHTAGLRLHAGPPSYRQS